MPEGHTLHRLAAHFTKHYLGTRLRVTSPQGRFAEGARHLDGRTLHDSEAHGKQLFLGFDSGAWLRVHLGLYGAWTFGDPDGEQHLGAPRASTGHQRDLQRDNEGFVLAPPPVGTVRVRMVSAAGWADLRGPSVCEVLTTQAKQAAQTKLGPDPLRADADPERAWRAIHRSRTAFAALLMRQDVIAGIGNIYRAESLFRAGIDPYRPGRDLARDEWDPLWADLATLLRTGVESGAIVTTRPAHRADPQVQPVPRGDAHYVSYRTGQPCRVCTTGISAADLAGRTLYWCPTCQRS